MAAPVQVVLTCEAAVDCGSTERLVLNEGMGFGYREHSLWLEGYLELPDGWTVDQWNNLRCPKHPPIDGNPADE